ncbi:MAG: hypothetical protein PHV34_09380 [Verrucomicrobiae bacterium]|nr:hypothetical protein [Verrucomicrobiae bacterium]
MLEALQVIHCPTEWVSPLIFTPEKAKDRAQFKRLILPAGADWFSLALYQGMHEYVLNGGLLITNSSLALADENENQIIDKEDGTTPFPREKFIGAWGGAWCSMGEVKVAQECPLSQGLPVGQWIRLAAPLAGRCTSLVTAEAALISNQIRKDHKPAEQPFLMYRQVGKGACIYLAGEITSKHINDPTIAQILKNIFSSETLEWLCEWK